jgi:hypothetical protein
MAAVRPNETRDDLGALSSVNGGGRSLFYCCPLVIVVVCSLAWPPLPPPPACSLARPFANSGVQLKLTANRNDQTFPSA